MTSRRVFLATGGAALLGVAGAPAVFARRPSFDIVLRGGTMFDGSGAAGVGADVGIMGGKIVEVGPRLARGTEEIDARGLAVAPGFVDIHSHVDGSLDDDPRAESAVRQGITTIIAGQDGGSRYRRGGRLVHGNVRGARCPAPRR